LEVTKFKRKVIVNTSWQFIDQLIRLVLNAILGISLARFFGKTVFGTFNYCLAMVAILAPLVNFGFDGFIIKDLLNHPDKKNEILGSSLILRLIGALLTIFILFIVLLIIRPNDYEVLSITFILAFAYIFQTFDIIDLVFKSYLNSRISFLTKSTAFILLTLIKIYFISIHCSLITFAILFSLEYFVAAILLNIAYFKIVKEKVQDWYLTINRIKYIFLEGWPMLLANLASLTYSRVDQVIVGKMLNDNAVGSLSASSKIYEMAIVIVSILNNSIYPVLINLYRTNQRQFFERYRLITEVYTFLSFFIFIGTLFFGKFFIVLLFGKEFEDAGDILSIQVGGLIFMFNAGLRSMYCNIVGGQRTLLSTTAIALIFNVLLNILLIPLFGVKGSAIATLITQLIALNLLNLFFKKTKPLFLIQLKAFYPFHIVQFVWKFSKRFKLF